MNICTMLVLGGLIDAVYRYVTLQPLNLIETENRLKETENRLKETETRLKETETRLKETEIKLRKTE